MRDENDARVNLGLELLEQVHNLRLDGHVQRRGRLVRDKQLGIARQRHGNHRALAHAAGILVRVLPGALLGVGDVHLPKAADGLARASARLSFLCSVMASTICLPTGVVGFRQVIGS